MSYQFNLSRHKTIPGKDPEDYSTLDENRKQKILNELQEEMEKLKSKYILNSINKTSSAMISSENPKEFNISNNSSILIKPSTSRRNIEASSKDGLLEKESSLIEMIPDEMGGHLDDNENQHQRISQIDGEIFFSQERDEENPQEKFKDIKPKHSSIDKHTSHDINSDRYTLFDKAKENLMKIKDEIDELNQYDYNTLKNHNEASKREIDLDEYIIEEERPKDFGNELSINKSIKAEKDNQNPYYEYEINTITNLDDRENLDTLTNNLTDYNFGYRFDKNVTSVSSNSGVSLRNKKKYPNAYEQEYADNQQLHSENSNVNNRNIRRNKDNNIELNLNRNLNLNVPASSFNKENRNSLSKSKSKSTNKTRKDRKKLFMGDENLADKSPTKEMNTYFKKMIKEYKPKYHREISQEKFNKIKSDIEKRFEEEHPFKPTVNYSTFFTPTIDKIQSESKDEFYKRLSSPKSLEINQRLKEKEMLDSKKLEVECTFKPNTEKSQGKFRDSEHVTNRLHKLAEQLKEKREKLKREYEENVYENYSFKPEIDKNSKQLMVKYETRPIHERYDDILRLKTKNLQKLKISSDKPSNYKPEINPKSKEIIMNLQNSNRSFTNLNEPIHERLYKKSLQQRRQHSFDAELENCTFSPNLGYSTIQTGGNIDDFLERQKIYEEIKKERLERKLSKSQYENDYTFTPQINLTSEILMKTNNNRSNENVEDKVNRLYYQDSEKLKQRKQSLEKFYYGQYNFKPRINEISRIVGKDHTIEDLAYKKKWDSDKLKVSKSALSCGSEEYTFKPKINKDKYENLQSNYKLDENISIRIKDEMKMKQEKVEEIKNTIETKNKSECKFQPDINKQLPDYENKEPIMMKGFAKYMEQMEKARKAKRDKEQREKEVFITGENWSRDNLITIPRPFNLSHQKVDKSKKEEYKKRIKEEELKNCTFKPETNESKNKEIIKMILKD